MYLIYCFLFSLFLYLCTLSSSESRETFLSDSLNGSEKIILISPSFQLHLSPPSMLFFSPLSGITIYSFSLLKLFFSPYRTSHSLLSLLQIPQGAQERLCKLSCGWYYQKWSTFPPLSHTPESIKVNGKVFTTSQNFLRALTASQPPRDTLAKKLMCKLGDQRVELYGDEVLTLVGSSGCLWPSSVTSGAVGTETGSKGDLAFPAKPRDAVLTWALGRLGPGRRKKKSHGEAGGVKTGIAMTLFLPGGASKTIRTRSERSSILFHELCSLKRPHSHRKFAIFCWRGFLSVWLFCPSAKTKSFQTENYFFLGKIPLNKTLQGK